MATSVAPSIPGNPPASSGLHPHPNIATHLCNRCVNTFLNSSLPPHPMLLGVLQWSFFFFFYFFFFFFLFKNFFLFFSFFFCKTNFHFPVIKSPLKTQLLYKKRSQMTQTLRKTHFYGLCKHL